MEDKLYIDYENLYSCGESFVKESANIDTNVEGILSILNNTIEDSWTGEDSSAYTTKLRQVCVSLTKYSDEINNIGEHLKTVASEYQNVKNTCIKELKDDE